MEQAKIIISPNTRVGELLDNYPELEKVLIEMSPAFEKLKNPILRKTVARVATLRQVAVVGGLAVDEIVNRLRKEAGQSGEDPVNLDTAYLSVQKPEWFSAEKVVARFDASPVINSGGSPMNEILKQTKQLNQGEIFELKTPFIPAPVIDMLKEKGFEIYCLQDAENFITYFSR